VSDFEKKVGILKNTGTEKHAFETANFRPIHLGNGAPYVNEMYEMV